MKAKSIFSGIALAMAMFAGCYGALEYKDWRDAKKNEAALSSSAGAPIRPIVDEATLPAFDFRAAAKSVTPSVVSVDRLQRVPNWLSNSEEVQTTGAGSGVILSADGIVVTNNHVVAGASEVKVRTTNGQSYSAKVLGRDPRSDLAVLKINATGLKPVEIGDSNSIEVGQWVLAVGNPLGFDNTVSVGVVSSLKRSLPIGGGVLLDAVQTDAAINPGNSGGALTDAQGKLVGINSAIASSTGQSVGIGFAIPVNRMKEVVADIVKLGYARYAGLGIRYNPNWDAKFLSDPQVRSELGEITGAENVPAKGIIVKSPYRGDASVEPGGPADKAGIKEWDVIIEIGGEPVNDVISLNKILTPHKPGDTVEVK
ncbi:MAG TPA: trypsin-like peptidase domain-containing protein, partial [Fimbriimonas sp.]|nr:trypsin-like peptidase domain-containing protein [Fimbriimonas sp.]